jgi:hypothetical protein
MRVDFGLLHTLADKDKAHTWMMASVNAGTLDSSMEPVTANVANALIGASRRPRMHSLVLKSKNTLESRRKAEINAAAMLCATKLEYAKRPEPCSRLKMKCWTGPHSGFDP